MIVCASMPLMVHYQAQSRIQEQEQTIRERASKLDALANQKGDSEEVVIATAHAASLSAAEYGELMGRNIKAMRDCPHPSVAAIRGICVGGGMELAGLCDVRICSKKSRFGVPISKLGLVMGYHEIDALRSLVGAGPTLEILLEGRVFDAEEAQRLGIVSRIVADDDVMTEARNAAERIAAGAPLVHRWHRKFLKRLQDPTPLSAEELAESYACFDTEDFQTGYRAFLEKKTPEFKGR